MISDNPPRHMSSETSPAPRTRELLFGIDPRSLAAFRIGLGLLVLWDLYGRAKTLRMHYTGEGVFPRTIAAELRPDSPLFRWFLLSDRFEIQATLFALFALAAALLALGWRTRWASVAVFVLLAALVRRNPYVCHTGDVLLKTLCFWGMFLPLGTAFSLDRLRGRVPTSAGPVCTLATAGVLLQIAIFYVMAGLLKARYDVWKEGEAVWIFTHVLEYRRPFGAWLGEYPFLCRLLTQATLVLEGVVPLLFFLPFRTHGLRIALVALFAAFHLTLQATIHIGIFQLLCIVMLTLLLPGVFWDGLARRAPRLWARAARWVSGWITARWGRAVCAPLASRARGARWAVNAFLLAALCVIAVSNVNSAVEDPYDPSSHGLVRLPQVVDDYGRQMSLVQSWNMFTDIDRLFFGWFLVVGQQEDGNWVDVLAHRPFDGLRLPEDYASFFPNHNSRRYWRELTLKTAGQPRVFLQKPMCDYLAREWERAGGEPLTHLAIYHIGRVPSRRPERDQVRPVCVDWEASHEPLKTAPPEVQERWSKARERWRSFLASLPKTVATNGSD